MIDRIKATLIRLLPAKHINSVNELDQATENTSVWLSSQQKTSLQQLVRNSSIEARLVERIKILLIYEPEKSHKGTARVLKLDPKTVRKWCHRWKNTQSFLQQLENQFQPVSERAYRASICEVLQDTPRSGAPDTFTIEQRSKIIALACEVLDDSDKPISHWTQKQIAKEAIQRGIVSVISRSSVGIILREVDIKPHRSRYWLNAPEPNTEEFAKEVETVCKLYEQAQALHEKGVHLVSTDEKIGIQALEREHSTHPAEATQGKGQELRESNYERHGTLCLIANFEVATGRIIASRIKFFEKKLYPRTVLVKHVLKLILLHILHKL